MKKTKEEPKPATNVLVIQEQSDKYTYAIHPDIKARLSETQKVRVQYHVTELLKIFNGDKGLIVP